ncbi:Ionotropic receptor 602 [Blattella germanica]|nr:Ionotropic receptor 602 [Blattella germanica]
MLKFYKYILLFEVIYFEPGSFLSYEQIFQISSCLEKILLQHFNTTAPIKISLSNTILEFGEKPNKLTASDKYNDELLDHFLQKINQDFKRLIMISVPGAEVEERDEGKAAMQVVLDQGYVFFVYISDPEDSLTDMLDYQVPPFKNTFSWNPRGKFIVVIMHENLQKDDIKRFAKAAFETFWDLHKVFDVLLIIPKFQQKNTLDDLEADVLDLYTWVPYSDTNCGVVNESLLVNRWLFEEGGKFAEERDVFPNKLLNNFNGCPLYVVPVGFEPYVMQLRSFSREDGSEGFDMKGLGVELIFSFANKHNFSIFFQKPVMEFQSFKIMDIGGLLLSGQVDIIVGIVPVVAPLLAFIDLSRSYMYESILWMVPCPKTIPRMERVVTIFTVSAWIMVASSFVFASVVIWFEARSGEENKNYKTTGMCFYCSWAVFMGVSVPELPRSDKVRCFFILYVCYCLAIITVFQAFFTTFLVEPGFKNPMKTMDDLVASGTEYGFVSILEMFLETTTYEEHRRLKKRKYCNELPPCVKQALFKNDLAVVTAVSFTSFLASEAGMSEKHHGCYLDELLISSGNSFGLAKGSPLINIVNNHLTKSFEGGVLDAYWSQLKHETRLKANRTEEVMYFVFSMDHLSPVFYLLIIGLVFAFIVLFLEIIMKFFFKVNLDSTTTVELFKKV